jgi:hypothetical protein
VGSTQQKVRTQPAAFSKVIVSSIMPARGVSPFCCLVAAGHHSTRSGLQACRHCSPEALFMHSMLATRCAMAVCFACLPCPSHLQHCHG